MNDEKDHEYQGRNLAIFVTLLISITVWLVHTATKSKKKHEK